MIQEVMIQGIQVQLKRQQQQTQFVFERAELVWDRCAQCVGRGMAPAPSPRTVCWPGWPPPSPRNPFLTDFQPSRWGRAPGGPEGGLSMEVPPFLEEGGGSI